MESAHELHSEIMQYYCIILYSHRSCPCLEDFMKTGNLFPQELLVNEDSENSRRNWIVAFTKQQTR